MNGDWLNAAWFVLLGGLLIGYAILDGIDLGVGTLHLALGTDDAERRTNLNAIGPFWASYEVWLIVAGGSMFAAFPRLYAASFSGFYLVLMLVLWLLIGRGAAIEFRSHVENPLWRGFWDVVFCLASLLLALLFGAAVGNVVRGVPLDAQGNFQGSFALTLNPYALLVGVLSVALLSMHGANFIAFKTEHDQQARARRWAGRLWGATAVLTLATSAASVWARPDLAANFARVPVLLMFPLLALAALIAIPRFRRRDADGSALRAGALLIGSLMASAGASLYPRLLPALGQPGHGLTIFNAAAPRHDLATALIANLLTMTLVIGYHVVVHRLFHGTVHLRPGEHSY